MSSWREFKLGDITEVIGGGTPKTSIAEYWNGNIPWLTPRDLTGYTKVYISHGERFITNDGLKSSSAKIMPKGTVLLTSRAPIGYVAIAENEVCTNQGFKSLVPNIEFLNSEFLYYWLKANTDYLQQLGTGTTFAEISGSVVKDIDISLPPTEEQKAIAEVLSSLDDKIDLLHRQNKTLEQLAQTLFRQWFIEEANTKSYKLEELIDSVSIKHSFKKDHVVFLNTSDIYNGNVLHKIYSEVNSLPGQAKKSIQKGDILFTEIRPANKRFAYINFEADDYVVSTKLMVLRNRGAFNTSLIYLFLKQQETLDYLQMIAESRSGTFPQITFDQLKEVEIFIPTDNQVLQYSLVTFDNVIDKTFHNAKQIQALENLRDTLLPKLLSGEVRVEI